MIERFLDDRIGLHCGDCRDVLAGLPADFFDACVTDPPYHLLSIVRRFSQTSEADATKTSQRVRDRADGYASTARGFMGKVWDGGDVAFQPDVWRAVSRVLKPGGHVVAFGGTRTYHRMACAIEDAGFEVRDCINWLYGSGFPKSHATDKHIDRALGAVRPRDKIVGANGLSTWKVNGGGQAHHWQADAVAAGQTEVAVCGDVPITPEAAAWVGWGTALKPGCELIVLARKALSERTVAANVMRWGTGAINVDGCRDGERWPANVVHDGSDDVVDAFPEDDVTGSVARFFYTAKADAADRVGADHPTVKPVDLMQWLIRLVTPPGGVVVDPFAGTGTTGEAAWREGMRADLVEREAEYQADIRRRLSMVLASDRERRTETTKARARGKPVDDGPLFGGEA